MSPPSILSFDFIDKLIIKCREHYRISTNDKLNLFSKGFDLFILLLLFFSQIKKPEELHNSKEEGYISTIVKAIETLLGIVYLNESGFDDISRSLLRNYVELTIVSMAIGYDNSLFTRWKNKHKSFKDVHSIAAEIQKSSFIPQIEKDIVQYLLSIWESSSRTTSHQLSPESVSAKIENASINFGIRIINDEYTVKRFYMLCKMMYNIVSISFGVFRVADFVGKNEMAIQLLDNFKEYHEKILALPD